MVNVLKSKIRKCRLEAIIEIQSNEAGAWITTVTSDIFVNIYIYIYKMIYIASCSVTFVSKCSIPFILINATVDEDFLRICSRECHLVKDGCSSRCIRKSVSFHLHYY
jgi:hypothetical protein